MKFGNPILGSEQEFPFQGCHKSRRNVRKIFLNLNLWMVSSQVYSHQFQDTRSWSKTWRQSSKQALNSDSLCILICSWWKNSKYFAWVTFTKITANLRPSIAKTFPQTDFLQSPGLWKTITFWFVAEHVRWPNHFYLGVQSTISGLWYEKSQ